MPRFIATYDLEKTTPAPHEAFAAEARKRGWKRWRKVENVWKKLPNTTLIGHFDNRDEADKAFDEALLATRQKIKGTVNLEKQYIASIQNGMILSDETSPTEPPF